MVVGVQRHKEKTRIAGISQKLLITSNSTSPHNMYVDRGHFSKKKKILRFKSSQASSGPILSQGVLRLFLEHRTGLAHVRLLIHYLINEYKAEQNPRTTTETKSDALKDN